MQNSGQKNFVISLFLFLSLAAWSISSPIGSGVDADFHLGSIWCARGEIKGLCESIDESSESRPTALVPFMFQMCDERNIYFWPKCVISSDNPNTQVVRIAPSDKQSVYYWTTHIFSSTNVSRSVVLIRLFNSLIASLVFFALLALSSNILKKAIIFSWTLTLIPNGIQLLTGINPRSWAVLGIMSSWAFLYGFLNEDKSNRFRRRWQLGFYISSSAIAASARFDALLFVCAVSAIIMFTHFYQFEKLTRKRLLRIFSVSSFLYLAIQYIPKLRGASSLSVPEPFGTRQYFVFQIIHLPEFVADWWSFSVGQQGNGPGIIGLVGVSLFSIHMHAQLQGSDRRQKFATGVLSIFIVMALFRATTAVQSIVPLTGVYTFGLVAPIIGVSVVYSKSRNNGIFPTGLYGLTVVLVGLMHALAFYHWIEFFTRRGVNTQFYETFSLSGTWWWKTSISPNIVFLSGSITFSCFLWLAWKSITASSPNESVCH
jgi:hypothetical protein